MAAVENMGEVDEVHSKGEDEVITNGGTSSDNEASASPRTGKGAVEPMEVDEEDSRNSADGNSVDGDGNSVDGDGNSADGNSVDGNSVDGSVPRPDGEQSDRESSNDEESRDPGDLAVDENTNNNSKDEALDRTDSGDDVCEKENPPSENENDTNSDEESDSKGETDVNTETLNDLIIKDSDNDEEMDIVNDLGKSNNVIELNETDEDDERVRDGKGSEGNDECETIELNDAGDTDNEGDVILIESPKENGSEKRKLDVSEVIDLDVETTPVKKQKVSSSARSVTPRRSSRNLNKQKSYVEENDKEEEEDAEDGNKKAVKFGKFESEEESDIEEVLPEDPLAMNNEKLAKSGMIIKPVTNSSTIVVKDTKKLVEIASKSSPATTNVGKKEPTLVIIDTNSILSGRGPVPIAKTPKTGASPKPVPSSKPIPNKHHVSSKQSSVSTSNKQSPLTISKQPPPLSSKGPLARPNSGVTIAQSNYPTLLPVALPAQGMYPANMRATITPIPLSTAISKPPQPPPLLPTLTDDMFVVEAPSFIVPYVYEKPPKTEFKEFVSQVAKDIADQKKREEEEKVRKEEEEKRAKEEEEKKVKEEKEKSKEDEEDKDDEENKEKEREESKEKDGENDSEKTEKNIEKKNDDKETQVKEKKDDSKEVQNDTAEKEKPKENVDVRVVKNDPIADKSGKDKTEDPKKIPSYFGSPLGKFFIDIGMNLVQEFVQNDLLRQQKRKRERERGQNSETNRTIQSLLKNLEYSKESNSPFKMPMKKCEFCHFKSESQLVLAYHLETPHMKNYVYKCNFCSYEVRSPHDILFHMEAEHAVRGRLERAPSFHQCSNCPFEDNQKGKLSRHLVACARKFKPERNLEPPIDWEPPAKIPRVPKMRQQGLNATAAAYQAMNKNSQYQFLSKMQLQSTAQANAALSRGRGRPTLANMQSAKGSQSLIRPGPAMVYKQTMSGGSVLVPTNYQLGNQVFQVLGRQELGGKSYMAPLPGGVQPGSASLQNQQHQQQNQTASLKKPVHQPSISITPLPRASTSSSASSALPSNTAKPGDTNSKNSFVICEICDGYIKDLEQLRNHMQWIHKIKIHPKMIYNRPPLNCQKCQFRFFTDQGLERHLLGSHGLVTSSMQDAANKSKDAGRCPVCGRVYQWKLLNHVARDHNMTLKPAHLSYKCTVCTATFGMYKQFENHVYSAHSVVAKRGSSGGSGTSNSEKKPTSSGLSAALSAAPAGSKSGNDLIKPLKINDEITIIPQPNKAAGSADGGSSASSPAKTAESEPSSSSGASSSLSRAERLARRNNSSTEGDD